MDYSTEMSIVYQKLVKKARRQARCVDIFMDYSKKISASRKPIVSIGDSSGGNEELGVNPRFNL